MIKKTILTGNLKRCEMDSTGDGALITLDSVLFNDPKFTKIPDNVTAELVVYIPQSLITPVDAEWLPARGGSWYLMSKDVALAIVGAGGSWKLLGLGAVWVPAVDVAAGKRTVVEDLASLKMGGYRYESSS